MVGKTRLNSINFQYEIRDKIKKLLLTEDEKALFLLVRLGGLPDVITDTVEKEE